MPVELGEASCHDGPFAGAGAAETVPPGNRNSINAAISMATPPDVGRRPLLRIIVLLFDTRWGKRARCVQEWAATAHARMNWS
ncbi:hypothetical protein [Actinophytocola glycyrrhizae]|uniref:Transposase of IS4/5 family DUF4096 n=1 Tax=Actinophytocola glycyrrhizae TaxID=2044873 RepID=A0ABV9S7S3_9PSEU